jgi:hypothetical protein
MSTKIKGVPPPSISMASAEASSDQVATPGTTRNTLPQNKSSAFTPSKISQKGRINDEPKPQSQTPAASDHSDADKSPSPQTISPVKRMVSTNREGVKSKKKRRSVRKWTKEEDERMRVLVKRFGTRKWSTIGGFLDGRNGKQCRERWHNQLDPNIKKTAWTEDEEVRFFFLFFIFFHLFLIYF